MHSKFWLVVSVAWVSCGGAQVGHELEGALWTQPPLPACTPDSVTFCGVESHLPLDNPHQGFESFHATASQLPADRHPHARVAYARYWWDELEPEQGQLRYDLIDEAMAKAAADGQTFAFRVMPEESRDGAQHVPAWLAAAAGGSWGVHRGVRYFSPDDASPALIEAIERTVALLGARYDGDPRLDHVDVGFVGDAGEWAYVVDGAAMPSEAVTARILDAFARSFRKTPVLMNVGAVEDGGRPLKAALERGMGWRADCWGDFRAGWNHHDDFYEQQLAASGALEAWRTSLVAVETCGDMALWDTVGESVGQVRWALRWALEHHVSLINNKSRAVPARYRPSVDEYLGFAGPRFFVFRASHSAGRLRLEVNNRGTTPPLREWRLAARLANGPTVVSAVSLARVTDWVDLSFELPAGSAQVALLDETGAVIHLANDGAHDDGWLDVQP